MDGTHYLELLEGYPADLKAIVNAMMSHLRNNSILTQTGKVNSWNRASVSCVMLAYVVLVEGLRLKGGLKSSARSYFTKTKHI